MNNHSKKDDIYKQTLANAVNCPVENLLSIVGPDEFSLMIANLSFDNYSVGKDFVNIKNNKFKANLHIHTNNSDGVLDVEDLLDQFVDYSYLDINTPVFFAITNHDIVDDVQKAVQIVADAPDRFKNVKLSLGVELSAKYENYKIFHRPVQLELLAYCINPFDVEIVNHLNNKRSKNIEYVSSLILKVNELGLDANIDEARSFHSLLNIGGSPGVMHYLEQYLFYKCNNDIIKIKKVREILDIHTDKWGHYYITPATTEISDIKTLLPEVILSIAHPAIIDFSVYNDTYTQDRSLSEALNDIYKKGLQAAEIYYQYPEMMADKNWIKKINQYLDKNQFLATGGIDSHGPSIFKRR